MYKLHLSVSVSVPAPVEKDECKHFISRKYTCQHQYPQNMVLMSVSVNNWSVPLITDTDGDCDVIK